MDKVATVGPDGWACWAYSNHDVVRHTSRWNLSGAAHRAYATLLMCLRGSACMYQGEELGLTEADVAFEDLQDPYGIEFWPEFKGRDGCRTPMVVGATAINGGFSDGQPWLPVAIEHVQTSADAQDAIRSRCCITTASHRIPQRHMALRRASMTCVEARDDFISFERRHGNVRMFCAFNLSDDACGVTLPAGLAIGHRWHRLGTAAEPGADGDCKLGALAGTFCHALKA